MPYQPGPDIGRTHDRGERETVSRLPKMTISMKRSTKARLEAYSTLSEMPAWKIVDEALKQFMETIPADDKWAVEGMAKRIEARHAVPRTRRGVA